MNPKPFGYKGNIDSIESIRFTLNKNDSLLSYSILQSAAAFKKFEFDEKMFIKSDGPRAYGTNSETFPRVEALLGFTIVKSTK